MTHCAPAVCIRNKHLAAWRDTCQLPGTPMAAKCLYDCGLDAGQNLRFVPSPSVVFFRHSQHYVLTSCLLSRQSYHDATHTGSRKPCVILLTRSKSLGCRLLS